jgi:DNA replication initiation complex subunit (GINS family)
METSITYEVLYDTLRKEKTKTELQKLNDSFYKDVINYIKSKKEILKSQEKKESIFTTLEVQKTRKQIENIQRIIKELYERRESKIIQLALIASRTNILSNDKSLMLEEEKQLYDSLLSQFNHFRNTILNNLLQGIPPETKIQEPKALKIDTKPKNTKLIRLIHEVPKFVGTDLNIYGPFEKEDVANLPTEIADLLIKKNKAEEISQ